ncbi:hypothetical protein B0H14DRAFT_3435808 [Mycena olivaceomarginata]|nr:hypothetical protein B0H14DRAFT_3435808 [Mycena olivaceomarginata]
MHCDAGPPLCGRSAMLARTWELLGVVEEAPSSPACDPATQTAPVLSSINLSENMPSSTLAAGGRVRTLPSLRSPPMPSSSPADHRTFLHSFVEDGSGGPISFWDIPQVRNLESAFSARSRRLLTDSLRPPPSPRAILFPSAPSMKFVQGFPLTPLGAPAQLVAGMRSPYPCAAHGSYAHHSFFGLVQYQSRKRERERGVVVGHTVVIPCLSFPSSLSLVPPALLG